MLAITNAEASANILHFAEEGRLTQAKWHDRDQEGREIACLLGAIHPSVTSPAECNGALMPMWLAELTPTLFDGIPAAEVVPIARRYGALVAHWDHLAPEAWGRVLTRFLIRTIDEAVNAARPIHEGKPYWPAVDAVCAQVKAALETGGNPRSAVAAWEASSSSWASSRSAAAAAAAASWASSSSCTIYGFISARSARSAAAAAARSVAWASGVVGSVEAVYFRLFSFLLDQIEAELVCCSAVPQASRNILSKAREHHERAEKARPL